MSSARNRDNRDRDGDGVGAFTATEPSLLYGSPEHYTACVARIRDIRKNQLGQKWEEVASLAVMSKSKLLKNLNRRPAEWTDFLDFIAGAFATLDVRTISYTEKRAEYLNKFIGPTIRAAFSSPPAYPSGLMEYTDRDFQPGDGFPDAALRFLQGEPPTPATAIHAAVPRSGATQIVAASRQHSLLLVHGAVAEGTSTVLHQAAHAALREGRRAFCAHPTALAWAGTLPWTDRPLVVVDCNADRLNEAPAWLVNAFPRDWNGCLVIGVQTRWRSITARLLQETGHRLREIRLPPVQLSEAPSFVDRIVEFRAAPSGLDHGQVQRLFEDGLSQRHYAELWPAQFQATRGVDLEQHFEVLVEGLSAAATRALSAPVFAGFLFHLSSGRTPVASRSLMDALIRNLDIGASALAESLMALQNLPSILAGELYQPYSPEHYKQLSDTEFVFRHPSVTETLFRWCFGAKAEGRGSFRYPKWPYYSAFLRALSERKSADAALMAYEILRRMEQNLEWDYRAGGGAATTHDRTTAVPNISRSPACDDRRG